ncbi:MAG: Holliday junction resolvase RuvX [Polyangiaceae bacterium]|nr:Holliday junction resolvase RuvX [Polyangiaceae bacterium]
MRAAGVDLGRVRIGLAVEDELGLLAHPRPPLDGRDVARAVATLAERARAEGIGRFVVGLPVRLDGREGPEARRARAFARRLEAATALPVELWDERLSSRQASALLREGGASARSSRGRVDGAAAALILQSYLDSRRARAQ